MHKCLYFLCPTDCLEFIINDTFKYDNYFYTSLGNSFVFDFETLIYLKKMVEKHHIEEIYFVLSMDNIIVLDALGDQCFSKIIGLKKFYNEIEKHNKRSKVITLSGNSQLSVISYYLNKKIKLLQLQLNNLSNKSIKIKGKIYNRDQDIFTNILPDLVCLEKYHLN